MAYERDLEAALAIARSAGELTLRYFAQETETEEKDDMSPVTVADRESEELSSGRSSASAESANPFE